MKKPNSWMWHTNLRTKAILLMASTLASIMVLVFFFVYDRVSDQLVDEFRVRGSIITNNLAESSAYEVLTLQAGEYDRRLKRLMRQHPEIEYIIVLRRTEQTGQPSYQVFAKHLSENQHLETLVDLHLLNPGAPVDEMDYIAFTEAIRSEARTDNEGDAKKAVPDPTRLDQDDEDLEPGLKEEEPPAPDVGPDKKSSPLLGYACVGMSKARLNQQKTSLLVDLIIVLSLALMAFIALFLLAANRVNRRVLIMANAARRIASGDLTEVVGDETEDEIGAVATELNRISKNLNDMMRKIQAVASSLGDAVTRFTDNADEVARGASHQVDAVDQTSSSMSQMLISLHGIAENVEILAGSAEESSSSILEMAATNDEMADNIHALASSVEQTNVSIEQMTQSVKEVAKSTGDLSAATEQTSSSMREMDVTITQVETNANVTAQISEEVRRDAEVGAEAVRQTIEGIQRISESTRKAFSVMSALGTKVQAIGQVLTVIDDVAEQTNLLALNAAIIAAQAGEHGKGFAVVADEIKDLADRTATSTSEIAGLIQAVQTETKNVIGTMQRGLQNVDEGVTLSAEAENALRKILGSTNKSTRMVREIAKATVEQARSSKEVTTSILRIAETVHKIANSTAEQARGSEQIMNSSERMRIITQHVHGSSKEQARGSKQITMAIESISEMVNHLNRAQRDQARGTEEVVGTVEKIKTIAERHSESMTEMKETVDAVTEQAEALRQAISRFKL